LVSIIVYEEMNPKIRMLHLIVRVDDEFTGRWSGPMRWLAVKADKSIVDIKLG
jgi:hypothetical protein